MSFGGRVPARMTERERLSDASSEVVLAEGWVGPVLADRCLSLGCSRLALQNRNEVFR